MLRISPIVLIAVFCIVPLNAQLIDYELSLLAMIPGYSAGSEHLFDGLPVSEYSEKILVEGAESNSLFKIYPGLQERLSYVALGDTPSPVVACTRIARAFCPSVRIFLKNDGKLGRVNVQGVRTFGGNKVRKLQYLLADAIAHGHRTVVTFGCTGSNHALQTTICARQVGLAAICMLKPQPNAYVVRRNLLLQQASGAQLHFSESDACRFADTLQVCVRCKQQEGLLPYIIPTGGSSPRGTIGYVEAAFELKEQIDAGLLPKPDHIYVTLGSGGTAAGLLLGLKAVGIETQVHCVLDEPADSDCVRKYVRDLFYRTNQLLISCDPSFPVCTWDDDRCEIVNGFTGTEYGGFTKEGVEAIFVLKEYEGILLDGVYTAKCFSALLSDLKNDKLNDTNVLFWDTFCAEDMTGVTDLADYHGLPAAFHAYFEQNVQPLDRERGVFLGFRD